MGSWSVRDVGPGTGEAVVGGVAQEKGVGCADKIVFVFAAMGKYEDDFVSAADTLLLGHTTYDSFAGSWPYVPDRPGAHPNAVAYAKKLNARPKIGFSKTRKEA